MYQIELNDMSIGGTTTHQSQEPAASFTSVPEDEARIEQMAAAMLPFVWPSFQLTAGQSLGKLRARSLDASRSGSTTATTTTTTPTTTASPVPFAPTWPMKYQQLSRTDRNQKSTPGPDSGGSAAASEFRSVFADGSEQDRARRLRSLAGSEAPAATTTSRSPPLTTKTSSTTTTTTPSPPPVAVSAATRPSERQPPVSGHRKRRKKSGHLQQQQRLERPRHQLQTKRTKAHAAASGGADPESLGDSTRLASSYPLPRIKFNASSPSPAGAASSPAPFQGSDGAAAPKAGGATAGDQTPPSSPGKAQIPKSLSKLIEQQLAQVSSAGSSASAVQHNLLLLRDYFASTKQNWSSPVEIGTGSGKVKLMLVPTTSVSRVVRLQSGVGANRSQLEVQHQVSRAHDVNATTHGRNSSPSPPADIMRTLPAKSALVQPAGSTVSPNWAFGGASSSQQHSTEPSVERDRVPLQAPAATNRTATGGQTTTAAPTAAGSATTMAHKSHHEVESAEIGSNKILPDDEEPAGAGATSTSMTTTTTATATTTTTAKPLAARNNSIVHQGKLTAGAAQSVPARQAKQPGAGLGKAKNNRWQKQGLGGLSGNDSKNIKLFHFKRKPDMNKLPFYKKPLNYTELGWSPEEIERDQRRLLELQQFSGQAGEPAADSGEPAELEADEEDESTAAAGRTEPTAVQRQQAGLVPTGELLLLKRKRRARSQFERLMAEFQASAAAAAAAALGDQAPGQQSPLAGASLSQAAGLANDGDGQRVPVIRKKVEPLVMKPMFFNVNQKRRQGNSTVMMGGQSLTRTANSTASTAAAADASATSTRRPTVGADDPARTRPIVRMRRKDYSEHVTTTLTLEPEPVTSPWRPTRPDWTQAAALNERSAFAPAPVRLMLVPSGLLTPSGSHPMPLIAATSSYAPSWSRSPDNSTSSGAGRAQWPEVSPLQQPNEQRPLSVAGMAPQSGQSNETPPVGTMTDPRPSGKPQTMLVPSAANGAAGGNELRVPKLLVKPMRPAKYSLNGYIPKPTLGQMQPAMVPMLPSAGLMQAAFGPQQMLVGAGRAPRPAKRNQQPAAANGQQHSPLVNFGQQNSTLR